MAAELSPMFSDLRNQLEEAEKAESRSELLAKLVEIQRECASLHAAMETLIDKVVSDGK